VLTAVPVTVICVMVKHAAQVAWASSSPLTPQTQ